MKTFNKDDTIKKQCKENEESTYNNNTTTFLNHKNSYFENTLYYMGGISCQMISLESFKYRSDIYPSHNGWVQIGAAFIGLNDLLQFPLFSFMFFMFLSYITDTKMLEI